MSINEFKILEFYFASLSNSQNIIINDVKNIELLDIKITLNKFIKPIISDNIIDENKTNLVNSKSVDSNVVFLKECGMNSFMNSICPILNRAILIKHY